MIGTFLVLIASPLLIFIILQVLKELYLYSTMLHYKRQGFKINYHPIFGFASNFIGNGNPKDQLSLFKERFRDGINEIALVWTNNRKMAAVVMPIDKKLTKAILAKELDLLKKMEITQYLKLGFFDKSGEEAMRKRGVFSRFFH